MSQQEEMKNLTLLGNKETPYIFEYSPQVLESFDNRHTDNDYFIKFNCPEFTSLCPITGQPDFASIYISYIPDQLCVESKSLKLYLFSYRNWGKFTPRGGISIDPYYNYGRPETKYEKMAEQRLFNHDLYPENIDNR